MWKAQLQAQWKVWRARWKARKGQQHSNTQAVKCARKRQHNTETHQVCTCMSSRSIPPAYSHAVNTTRPPTHPPTVLLKHAAQPATNPLGRCTVQAPINDKVTAVFSLTVAAQSADTLPTVVPSAHLQ